MGKWLGYLAKVKRPFLKYKKTSITLLVLVLLVGGIVTFVHALNAPAVGSLNQTPPAKAEVVDPYAEPGNYKGKYLGFDYPAHYRKTDTKTSGSYLEVVNYYSTDHTQKSISVGVMKGSLDSESGISFRKSHPETYTAEARTKDSVAFDSKTGGNERTVYVQHGEYIANISVSTPNGQDVATDSQFIVSSLRWPQ
jgi:hypothetical protein